jgi:hypothetical protein
VSLLKQTNQMWKIYVFGIALLLGSAASLLQGFFYEDLGQQLAMRIGMLGIALLVSGFIWAGFNVRCPSCQLNLFAHAFKTQGFFTWFAWLLQVESCPQCGQPELPRSTGPRRKVKGLKRP